MDKIRDLLYNTLKNWYDNDGMTESAALAFYAIISLPALLLFSFSFGGLFLKNSNLETSIVIYVSEVFGASAGEILAKLINHVPDLATLRIGAIVGFFFLLGSASRLFTQMKKTFNKIWGVKQKESWFKYYLVKKIISLATVLIFGLLLIIGVVIEAMFLFFSGFLSQLVPYFPDLSGHAASVSNFVVFLLLFMFIYRVLLEEDIPAKHEFVGSLFTVVLITISKYGLTLYLSNATIYTLYGALGSFLGIFLWIYYTFCVITLGVEFTKYYAELYG